MPAESMEHEVGVKPGFFHLFKSIDEKTANAMIDKAREYRDKGYPSLPLQNVVGVLKSNLGKREEAIGLFKQVLLKDPENLNALENSRFVHDLPGQEEDAEVFAEKVKSSLRNGDSPREIAARKARCLAEQGIAISCHTDEKGLKVKDEEDLTHAKEAMDYFEKAIQVDDDNEAFEPDERLQWHFFLGRSSYKVFSHCTMSKECVLEDQLGLFNKAVRALIEVARNSKQNHYRAMAWTFLGTIFWKMSGFVGDDQPCIVLDCDLEKEYNNPEDCFETACSLRRDDPEILTRYSRFLMNRRRYKEAIEVLTKSIEIDDSKKNWLGFASRAEAYKKMYLQQQEAQGPKLLMLAKEDLEHLVQINQKLQEMVDLGEILTMLKQYDKAIDQFQGVIDRLEGRKNYNVHKKMGFCLQKTANSDPRLAVESFKRAVEIERSNLPKSVSAFNALKWLLIMYNQARPEHLLYEICYWLAEIEERYEDQAVFKLVQGLCDHSGRHMVSVCKRLVDQKMFNLASKCLLKLKERDDLERREIDQLETEIETCSAEMSALSLSEAEQHTKSVNIRPAVGSSKNKNKTFDCLVLHSTKRADSDWVHYSLLPRLEGAHGYKCCVPARDIHPHSARDFDSCVGDAGRVIVVLTPSFCSDAHCKDQLAKIVGAGSSMVIPVMREDCELPDDLSGMKVIQYYSWELLLQDIEKRRNPC